MDFSLFMTLFVTFIALLILRFGRCVFAGLPLLFMIC
jgi:hypothetical protein